MLHLWLQYVPRTDGAIRLLAVFWNLLLIPAIYALALELLGRRYLALFVAWLAAISPFHVFYSHELRMYTQLMLLVTLGSWAYLKARRSDGWLWWLLFGAAYLAAIYTHLFAFFALLGIGLYTLIHRRQRRAFWKTILVGLALALLFLPWAWGLIVESQKDLGSMRPLLAEPLSALKLLTVFTFMVFGSAHQLFYQALALFLVLAVGVILIIEIIKARRVEMPPSLILPLAMIASIVGLPLLIYYIRPFYLPVRTMSAASPFIYIILAWGLTRPKTPLPYLIYSAAVVMFAGTLLYLSSQPAKPPYRDVMQLVAQNRLPGDAILHTSDGSYLPALRYVDLPDHAVLAGDPDPRKPRAVYYALGGEVWDLEQTHTSGERLWLIVALEHSLDWQKEQANYFASRYSALQHYNLGGIDIYLYDLGDSGR